MAMRALFKLGKLDREMRAPISLSSVGGSSLGHAHGVVLLLSVALSPRDGRVGCVAHRDAAFRFVGLQARGAEARDRGRSLLGLGACVDPKPFEGSQPRVDVVPFVGGVAISEPCPAVDAESRTVGVAEWCDRRSQGDRLAQQRVQVQFVMIGKAHRVGLRGQVECLTGDRVRDRQDLFANRHADRGNRGAEASGTVHRQRGAEPAIDEDPTVRSGHFERSADRGGEHQVVIERDVNFIDFEVSNRSCGLCQEPCEGNPRR